MYIEFCRISKIKFCLQFVCCESVETWNKKIPQLFARISRETYRSENKIKKKKKYKNIDFAYISNFSTSNQLIKINVILNECDSCSIDHKQ